MPCLAHPPPPPPPATLPQMGILPDPALLPTIPTFALSGPSGTQLSAAPLLSAPLPSAALSSASAISPYTPTATNFFQFPSGSLPPKLTKKILDLEFVDMTELIPETWRLQEEEETKCCHQPRRTPRRGPVTDIMLWVECYASLVAVLTSRYPDKGPEFMSYLRTIVHAQRTFSGEGWVTYDLAYRRQAAILKTLNWSQIDFNRYNEIFTGRAKPLSRCRYCMSENHRSDDCRYAPEHLPAKQGSQWRNDPRPDSQMVQVCRLFNNFRGNLCRYRSCRYAHLCGEPSCRGQHPLVNCPRNRSPPLRRARSRSPPGRPRSGTRTGPSPAIRGA